MSTLRHALNDLAQKFADDVLAAIRGASIEELTSEAGAGTRHAAPSRARSNGGAVSAPRAKRAPSGRLARRSPEQIQASLTKVSGLLRQSKGMRSEEIQKRLGMDRRELPRVLKLGLDTKKLKKKGEKRATIYSAA